MIMEAAEINRFFFLGNFIGGVVVATAASLLLAALVIKGYTTKTLTQYSLVYLLLFNIIFIWTCQIATVSGIFTNNNQLPLS
jgi:hypothetical protein